MATEGGPKDRSRRISSMFSLTGQSEPKLQIPQSRGRSPAERLLRTARSISPGGLLTHHHPPELVRPRHLSADNPDLSPVTPASATLAVPSPSPLTATSSPSDKRRSWRVRSRANSAADPEQVHQFGFWIPLSDGKIPYDATPLLTGQRVSPLRPVPQPDTDRIQVSDVWNEEGDTFVHLFPNNANKGPSFKVDSSVFSSSSTLNFLANGGYTNRRHASLDDATRGLFLNVPASPPMDPLDDGDSLGARSAVEPKAPAKEDHLYLPLTFNSGDLDGGIHSAPLLPENVDMLIDVRNLFAFLMRSPLVATPRHPTLFAVLLRVSGLLGEYKFSNIDGSSFGEVATDSFNQIAEDARLADVRHSREKNMEALVLGERMRCVDLYNEAFVHGVGRWSDIKALNSPIFELIGRTTRNRMDRSKYDLERRVKSVTTRLSNFEFPSLFAGIANSATESKTVHFKAWKQAFLAMRRHIMGFYKAQYGSWPPKSSSKRNDFEEEGLNRIVLQLLYRDLTDLYDLMVDRTALTTRSMEVPSYEHEERSPDPEEPSPRALRRVMSEYDRSTPPVQPPIPFDTPNLPSSPGQNSLNGFVDPKKAARRLRDEEVDELLMRSYNPDANKPTLFLASYRTFERRMAHGKSIAELCDQRNGHWIFLYAVLQTLPMLVVDAQDLRWHQGVEYFLCQPPKGGVPWSRDDSARRKSWYGVAGGSNVVLLPSDVVDHGVEGVYHRSHCWTAAEHWSKALPDYEVEDGPNGIDPDHDHDDAAAAAAAARTTPAATIVVDEPHAPLNGSATPSIASGVAASVISSEPERPEGSMSPPPAVTGRARRYSHRKSVINLGLETLPVPSGVDPLHPQQALMPTHDPTKSFEDIIAGVPGQGTTGRKR
ncbi:MAG: hypothetical protein M1833_001086 [Piccolia ochrophora]|nr:MAG: hypothetical protein M1833_001086 [Piccolia ochrophora]